MIHAGHLRGFPADKGASRLLAALGNPGDHLAGLRHIKLARGKVIQKEQRLGPLHDKVIHRHGHQINANPVVQARFNGHAQFGANPVIGGHQNRVLVAAGLEVKQPAKPAKRRISALAPRCLGQGLDRLNQGVSSTYIHARVGIGDAVLLCLFAVAHAASLP